MHRRLALAPLALALTGMLAACSTSASSGDASSSQTNVVATTTILGSVTADVVACADPDATVSTLMPIGADSHDFAPSSAQVADLVAADLVVANGLGLEAGLADALDNATADGATVLEVAERVDPLPFGEQESDHADEGTDEHADEHGDEDPHFWLDMQRMATAAEVIGDELGSLKGGTYGECGRQVADEIRAAEADVRATLDTVPADRRVLVTDHEAFGYFADAYGFTVVGTVIPGGSTMGEPSSADLADLVAAIDAEGVPAIFANSTNPSALAESVAAETGRDIAVVPLYVESLGPPDSGADDYIGLMTVNADLIATALTR